MVAEEGFELARQGRGKSVYGVGVHVEVPRILEDQSDVIDAILNVSRNNFKVSKKKRK